MKHRILSLMILAQLWGCFVAVSSAMAKAPTVYAALFYSPTCSHCAKLDREFLSPLQNKYGNKLVIVRVNIISAAGINIYEKALERFKVPENRIGVPALVIGDTFLMGTAEIPGKLPGLIDEALSKGGIDMPDFQGLYQMYFEQRDINLKNFSIWQLMIYKFKQDVVANGIAVLILAVMIVSMIAALVIPLSSVKAPKVLTIFPSWIIPLLVAIGLATAVYLSYVEVSEMRAFCGPVGNCNAVQNSPYAKLFGILPIPILGIIGYTAILAVWIFQQLRPASLNRSAQLILWGLSFISVLFSSYLTFLEPFVIGATCAFCLTSAVVVTMILWASILPTRKVMRMHGDGGGH
ncbi:Uncharacterized membrane protein [Syntrophus gentianae]|uniref:Uncharacterized membrane protein n=1 Tax=Syntrophus gentianae TaxID=43775 RepID=A0A1H7ZVP4_9BACT|nr:vitamin K epoxide reductase family protein [Syntrophus gentianae]SEM61579.1 Uncharacterized membrane protein [Syntrophus gentianae]